MFCKEIYFKQSFILLWYIVKEGSFFFSPRENKLSETGIGYFVLGTYQSYEEILKIETGYILAEMISLYWKFKKKKV